MPHGVAANLIKIVDLIKDSLQPTAGEGLRLTAWLPFPADGQTCFSNSI
jgi:hypothetical protein